MDTEQQQQQQHHLVFIPGPGMGHIIAAVEMAKLILRRDNRLSIKFLLINDPHVQKYTQSLDSRSDKRLRFLNLPEPHQTRDHNNKVTSSKLAAFFAFERVENHKPQVKNAVLDILASSQSPQIVIDAFIVDMFCVSMIDVAKEFEIPTYMFFTSSAAFLSLKLHVQALYDDEERRVDITEYNKYSDHEFTVPGFLNGVPAKVFPSAMMDKDRGYGKTLSTARIFRETKGILINTFRELELSAVESLSSCGGHIPPVYPVGPILHLMDKPQHEDDDDDDGIFSWLDNQPDCSVVFLCFGSQGRFSEAQIKHIAIALERSGLRFLWSLRTVNNVTHDEVLPPGFLEKTSGVGKVIGLAQQVAVLSHSAIGGFVSHCGWNSIMESLWFGVPIAAWPIYAEQQVNAFEMVVELGMATEIKMDYNEQMGDDGIVVTSEQIEKAMKQLLVEKDVHGIREKVNDIKEKSRRALVEGGSSYEYLGRFIHDILQNSSVEV